jgi:hypothetical protein
VGDILQNYERLDVKEMIWLHASENTISLSVKFPSGDPSPHTHVASMADTTIKKDHSDLNTKQFTEEAIKLISEIGHRYGNRLAGYWFDDFYEIETRYSDFPYRLIYEACKAGNPRRLVSLTNWIYPSETLWQDYWGGELFVTGNPPIERIQTDGAGKGLPFQALLALYGDWVHVWPNTPIKPPVFTVDELGNFINATKGKGAVTLNAGIYLDGTIGEDQTKYFEELRLHVYGK